MGVSKVTLIKADIDRYVNNPDLKWMKTIKGTENSNIVYLYNFLVLFFRLKRQCFRNLFYYRLGRWSMLISWFFRVPFNTTRIWCPDVAGGGIYFSHAWGTVLNCDHIGYGCSFLQNTTLGNKPTKDGKYVRPWLGEYVHVGANVVIIGGVHIGNNVIIGAGSVVTKDIPDNCTVVGNPARIIKKDGLRVDIPL